MSRPEGRTEQERWPADTDAAEYYAAPFVLLATGLVLGILAAPYVLGGLVVAQPVVGLVIVALGVGGFVLARSSGSPAARLGRRLVRVASALGLLALVGAPLAFAMGEVTRALCGADGCEPLRAAGSDAVVPAALGIAASCVASVAAVWAALTIARAILPRAAAR